MYQEGSACAAVDGLSIRQHSQAAPQDVDTAAQARFAPEDAWKEFIDPDKWEQVQESMDVMARAKKLSRKAMQQLRVREDDPDHVKVAELHKIILQEAAAETEDLSVAKKILTVAGSLPSAYSKAAAKYAEEQAAAVDRVAIRRSKAIAYKESLRERLREIDEETARYEKMGMQLKRLKEMKRQVEEYRKATSKRRAALAATHAAVNQANLSVDEEEAEDIHRKVDDAVKTSQASRQEWEAWFDEKLALRFVGSPMTALEGVL